MDILQYINKMNRLYGNDPTPVRFNTQQYLQGGRVGYKLGGNEIIAAYNKAAELAGGNPSIEQVRAATGKKPNIYRVREILDKANLTLSKPRGGLKEEVLKVYVELKEKLGRLPTSAEIDEKTKGLSKMKDANQRKSVITDYLNKEKLPYTISEAGRTSEARAKAAETLKAKEFPRKGQPRKTPEDKRLYDLAKTEADIERDPKRVKRAIADVQKGTGIDVHHPYPKSEYESLRRLMPLDKDVNRAAIKGLELERDKLKIEPFKNKRRLNEINALMKKARKDLRKVPGGKGTLAFPIKDEAGKITKWVGIDTSKTYGGLNKSDLVDLDFKNVDATTKAKLVQAATGTKKPGAWNLIKKGGRWLFGPVEMGMLPLFLAGEGLYANYANKRDLKKALDKIPISKMPQYKKDLILEGYRQEARDIGDVGLETYAIDKPNVSGALEKIGFGDTKEFMDLSGKAITGVREVEAAEEAERYRKLYPEAQKEKFDVSKPMFKSGGKVGYDNYLPDIDDDK